VAGLKCGRGSPEADRERLYAAILNLVRAFEERFGTTACRELTGYDLSDPEQLRAAREAGLFATRCTEFVEFCAAAVCSELRGAIPG
jgi:hypothetical protein